MADKTIAACVAHECPRRLECERYRIALAIKPNQLIAMVLVPPDQQGEQCPVFVPAGDWPPKETPA
jgi:hypothetical protein